MTDQIVQITTHWQDGWNQGGTVFHFTRRHIGELATIDSEQLIRQAVKNWANSEEARDLLSDLPYPLNWGDVFNEYSDEVAPFLEQYGLKQLPQPPYNQSFAVDHDEILVDATY